MTNTTQQCKQYTLREAREILGLSRCELAEQAGVSPGVVYAVEYRGRFCTSYRAADALARALGLEIYEIFWPRGLSHLGRPVGTGAPLSQQAISVSITMVTTVTMRAACSNCFVELPCTGRCDFCF